MQGQIIDSMIRYWRALAVLGFTDKCWKAHYFRFRCQQRLTMPPKKAKLADPKQPTLFGMLQKPEKDEQENKSSDNNESVTTESNQKKQKVRTFNEEWFKYYSWLAYDKQKDYMYCTLCTKRKMECQKTPDATITRRLP